MLRATKPGTLFAVLARYQNIPDGCAIAHCLAGIEPGMVPTERLMFPAGDFVTTKGTFLFDDKAAQAVMADWNEWTGGLPDKGSSDYEHDQSKDTIPGHLKLDSSSYDVELRDGAFWTVNIKWTDLAAGMIQRREKRFTSPWWLYEKASKRIVRYINFGLVSMPATIAQPELMAAAASASVQVPECFAGFMGEVASAAKPVVAADPPVVVALKQIWVGMLTAGAIPHAEFPLDASKDWDEEAAEARGLAFFGGPEWESVDKKGFATLFAYVSGDGSKESDYQLLHHDIEDGKVVTVLGGVIAAAAEFPSAEIPEADRKKVAAHLAAHYKEFGVDPPEVLTGKKMAPDYKDPGFKPEQHAWLLRDMTSSAMSNMMASIHLHADVPMLASAMELGAHVGKMADHVAHCAAAMVHHMAPGKAGEDDSPDDADATLLAKFAPEVKAKIDAAFAACKAAKVGGGREGKALQTAAFAITGQKTPLEATAALAAMQRDLGTTAAQLQTETAARIAAETAADKVKYDDLIEKNRKKVTKGPDEEWVRAHVIGSTALAAYLVTKKEVAVAQQHQPANASIAGAHETPEQRKAAIAAVELPAAQLAAWIQTGGGEDRLFNLQEVEAKRLGLVK